MDFQFIGEATLKAANYIPITLLIATTALLIGAILGLLIALLDYFKVPVIRQIFRILITILKGIPLILLLIVFYVASSDYFDAIATQYNWSIHFKDIPPAVIAILALSLFSTVNFAENFRSALLALPSGQSDAGYSIGYTKRQLVVRILLPQALASVLPHCVSLYIGLVKGTALASIIAVVDILQGALIEGSMRNLFLESYIAAAIVYWVVNLTIELLGKRLEKNFLKKRGKVLAHE